ncbi:unnamed protein product [Nippostrongylus brasiliensis]|uniref:Phosphomethylpyrimidine kinase n=1 Tax=Nippostrongylus brasiliensis TaxID=27835 RepID=A0A0N4Y578_NIPBR|nr:unnamed protein product [Nippostrongylus brasiliensis]
MEGAEYDNAHPFNGQGLDLRGQHIGPKTHSFGCTMAANFSVSSVFEQKELLKEVSIIRCYLLSSSIPLALFLKIKGKDWKVLVFTNEGESSLRLNMFYLKESMSKVWNV